MQASHMLLDELLGEDHAPLVSPGIPVGDGRLPSVGNSLHPDAAAARRAASTEAARLNAASPRVNPATGAPVRFRYRVAHHAAKQPQDAPHYHVIDEQGNQISGHFFYGRQPIRTQKKDRPTAPAHDRDTPSPGANPDTSYTQFRTEWHGARLGKAEGRQRRRMQKGYELEQESSAALSVIDPNIDVHAQYAIQRMLKSPDPAAQADGAGMLGAVKSGQMGGIHKEDQYAPAMWARRNGTNWWQLIPPGEDYGVLLTAFSNTEVLPAMIVFRDSVRSNPARLDPALRKGWAIARLVLLLRVLAPQLTLTQLQALLLGQPLSLGDQQTFDRVRYGLQQAYGATTEAHALTTAQKARKCSCGANLQCLKLRFFCICLSGSIKPQSFMLKLCSYA